MSYIQRKSQVIVDSIKENDIHGAIEAWKILWDCYILPQAVYFVGDGRQN
jgi:hypothetical protein